MNVPFIDLSRQHRPLKKDLMQAFEGVLDSNKFILGNEVKKTNDPRRPGDVPVLYADASRAMRKLDWKPEHGLETMVADTLRYVKRHM